MRVHLIMHNVMNTHSDLRLNLIHSWLNNVFSSPYQITPITGDASFRRYFRITFQEGQSLLNDQSRAIIMDAPPPKESIEPFCSLSKRLNNTGIAAPYIFKSDEANGFLLLEDFGDTTFLQGLTTDNKTTLYKQALDQLIEIQTKTSTQHIPEYSEALLQQEMSLFTDWFLTTHLGMSLSLTEQQQFNDLFHTLTKTAKSQPTCFVHRDYHSRNLMLRENQPLGIIDFQDAVLGPITYDAVSLLRDCYIQLDDDFVESCLHRYHSKLIQCNLTTTDWDAFKTWFDFMALQRHLKVAGIFARLYHRDGKSGYLNDIPLAIQYIYSISAHYPETQFLYHFIKEKILDRIA